MITFCKEYDDKHGEEIMDIKLAILKARDVMVIFIFIFLMKPLRNISANDLFLNHIDTQSVYIPNNNYHLYIPFVRNSVLEEIPLCRWPHNVGTYTSISYKWGDRLQSPGTLWRIAFEAAIIDWNSATTMVYFYYLGSSSNVTVAQPGARCFMAR